ncbi:MAG: alpha/beta fold hydrolase [Candidatus Omnitrophica bacterium]|nr:alpha/beta fold hydrolase [Candidatus Omnitrophota bacterium]
MLSYESTGQGERTLVFLHGFGGHRGYWRHQVTAFASRARCITIDLPGHGDSPWQPSTLAQMGAQLTGLLRQAGVCRAHLVASSFGGLVALEAWRQQPDRLGKLTLAGSTPRFTSTEDFPAGLDPVRIAKLAGQLQGEVGTVLDMFFRSLFTMGERSAEHYAWIRRLRPEAPLPSRDALLAMLDILDQADLRDVFARVDVPVQLVVGDGDYICPPAMVGVLRAMQPAMRVDMFTGCGHFPFLGFPQEFNRVLSEFAGL